MFSKFLIPYIAVLFLLVAPLSGYGQDDLYGDKRPEKEKKTTTEKSKEPKLKKSPTTNTPVRNVSWNDPVTSEYSLLFFYRKFEANKLPVSIYKNETLVANLDRDGQLNYKVFSQGQVTITAVADGIARKHTLTLERGKKYFFEVSMMNPSILQEVPEAFAVNHYSPSTIKRIAEGTEQPKKKRPLTKGFLLSSEGYVVTSLDGVDSAKSIFIKGLRQDPEARVPATYLLGDRANNLAILQVKDTIPFPQVPYGFKSGLLDVGDTIYIYGYLNNELRKITSVIASRSGNQGDINSYQISPAIALDYNGAPAFDKNGNIVGIVNHRSPGTTTSILTKSRILFNLTEESGKNVLPAEKTAPGFFQQDHPVLKSLLIIEAE